MATWMHFRNDSIVTSIFLRRPLERPFQVFVSEVIYFLQRTRIESLLALIIIPASGILSS
ncbi:hypothetical protein CKO51_32965 [Rhodopirellula sp. SM50]|nr:hypothetical protein CKO51_32965 [Rhodopirellula sp. SM50]